MRDCFFLFHNFFQITSIFILFFYGLCLIYDKPIFLYNKCYNWNNPNTECIQTNWKMLLLFDFLYQDAFFTFYNDEKIGKIFYKYCFYTCFLLLVLITCGFSINIYIDTFTISYVLYMYLFAWRNSRKYETITDDNDYPEVEIKSNKKTKYYQFVSNF